METLEGESLHVKLKIKRGKGFSFISNPIIIAATLDGITLETSEFSPGEAPIFNAELTWLGDKKYLRRLRQINTALKIECFIVINEQKRNKLGYICLNLRQAQIFCLKKDEAEITTWHNFLGVPREIKACNPQILLVFKIQEFVEAGENQNAILSPNNFKKIEFKMDEGRQSNYLQIGPPKLCTKFYEIDIDITETGNLCSIISPNDIGTPLKLQFHVMGMTLTTKEFYGFKGIVNKEKFKVQIKSEIQFLAAYFKQFPSLTFYLICGEKLIGSGSLELQDLTDLTEHFIASTKEKVLLKSSDGKDSHVTECLTPFLKVEVTLIPMLPRSDDVSDLPITNQIFNISTRKLTTPSLPEITLPNLFEEQINTPEEIHHTSPEEPVISSQFIPEINLLKDSIKTSIHINSTPQIRPDSAFESSNELIHSQYSFETKIKVDKIQDEVINKNEEISSSPIESSQSSIERNIQNPNLVQQSSPHSMGPPNSAVTETLPKIYVQELAIKYVEELEDWKEKQQEMFKFELKRKSEKHLNKLSYEWSKRQQALENELIERLENCHTLKTRLEEVLVELEIKLENLNKFEQELQYAKNELDRRYTMKFKELRKASKKHQNDMEEKIKQSNLEKNELKTEISDYEGEITRLNKVLKSELETRLSVEESKKLLTEKEILEEKLEKALESKNYFKEQCNLAVRQIHNLKGEKEEYKKWQFKKDKNGREIIGLVEEINNEVDEMRKDQSTLNALRDEIIKYNHK